jgi:ABC-type cobalamin transport system permease subunit
MRTLAILAGIIIGAAFGMLAGVIVQMAAGTDSGIPGLVGFSVGAFSLPMLIARLVPRSGRAQRRHDQAMARVANYSGQYPNRVIRRD